MTLFALTAEDIAVLRKQYEPRPCKGCGTVRKMRLNQQYCNAACRTKYSPTARKSKPPIRLNDLTRAEIQALTPATTHECLWCTKHFFAKPTQSFCSLKCKNSYSNASNAILLEKLQTERAKWLIERESLVREISELRKRLDG